MKRFVRPPTTAFLQAEPARQRPTLSSDHESRASLLLGITLAASVIPVPTPHGVIYGAEVLAPGAVFYGILRRPRLSVPVPVVVFFGAIVVSAVYYAVGLSGPTAQTLHLLRATWFLMVATLAIANFRHRDHVLKSVPLAANILAAVVVLEFVLGFQWPDATSGGFLGQRPRILGPVGPGPSANIFLAAIAVSVSKRLRVSLVLQVVALLLLASRAHYVGLAVLLLLLARPAIRRSRRLIGGLLGVVCLVFIAFPPLVQRIADLLNGAAQRSFLWRSGVQQLSLFGRGPAGYYYNASPRADGLEVPIFYSHSQYLTPVVYWGIGGGVLLGLLLMWLVRRARRTDTTALVAALLSACVFGEFLWGASVKINIGAAASWLVLMTSRRGAKSRSPASASIVTREAQFAAVRVRSPNASRRQFSLGEGRGVRSEG